MTHCGNNGQFEAIDHGVPMIGFPTSQDQPYNAARLASKGYGVAMDILDFTAVELAANVRRIVDDDGFRERTMRASRIMKSRPEPPAEKAARWIEHVVRFGGAHLRSASADELSDIQFFMLDVLALLVVLGGVFIAFLVKTAKVLIRKCRHNGTKDVKRKAE